MGTKGPIPKRSEERRRRNTTDSEGAPNEAEQVEVDEAPVRPLAMNENWHDDAKEFYQACIDSVQSRFYEPSDWAALKMACETQSRMLDDQAVNIGTKEDPEIVMQPVPIKGADLSALAKVWSSLMVTEGDRRRLRLEIQRKADQPAAPATADQVVASRGALFAVK